MGAGYQKANQQSVTIASGSSLSSAVFIGGRRILAIQMPASWTAADLTLQAAERVERMLGDASAPTTTQGTFQNVYDDADAEVLIQAAAARYILIGETLTLRGLQWVKVRSGTSAAAITQAADRTLTLILADE